MLGARDDPERHLAVRDRVVALADVYGALLTPRQREAVGRYYEDDLSLGELAASAGVSRQAVHDLLRRTVAALEMYETQLGLLRQADERRRVAAALIQALEAARTGSGDASAALGRALELARSLGDA